MGKTILRVALGALAGVMVPLVASRLVPDWNWNPGAFVLVFVLLFGTGMAYALIARRMKAWSYKAGAGVALAAGLGLGWSNMVHVSGTENPANLVYYGVLALGIAGACLVRLRAGGLAWTLFAMAAVMAGLSLMVPSGAPPDMDRRMAMGHGALVILFTASGLLFRHASAAAVK